MTDKQVNKTTEALPGFDRSKYTDEQWNWCLEYLRITDYEPMMCDFENGTYTFYRAAQTSVQWYEDHTSDMHLKISRTIEKFNPEYEGLYD